MFSLIRKIMAGEEAGGQQPAVDHERKKHLAAAVIMLEAAHVDNECTADELEHVVDTIGRKFELEDELVAELMEVAHAEKDEAIDLWQFTNWLNQSLAKGEKMGVMEDVWRIIFMDGKLDKHEDYFAHKLANLLRLSHTEMVEAKLKAREAMKIMNHGSA